MVGPEAFTEVKYLMHAKQMQALDLVPRIAGEFAQAFGRSSGGLLRSYPKRAGRDGRRRARLGARHDRGGRRRAASRRGRHRRARHQVLPSVPARRDPAGARRERDGWSSSRRRSRSASAESSARTSASRSPACRCRCTTSSPASAADRSRSARSARSWRDVLAERLEPDRLTFLDLDRELVERELHRISASRRSGPHAENILRDVGAVAAGSH